MIDLFRCCEVCRSELDRHVCKDRNCNRFGCTYFFTPQSTKRVITEEGIIIETSNHFLEPGEVPPQPGPSQRSSPKDDKKGKKDGKKDKKKDKNKGSSS